MTKINRRDFLQLVGAGGVGTGAGFLLHHSSKERPEQYIPYVVTPEDYSPGVATWYNTVCGQCSAGCGIRVRIREGRAKIVEGNPLHPVSQGRSCSLGQASLNALYNPDRLASPMKRSGERGSAAMANIAWDEALAAVTEKLAALSSRGTGLYVLGGERRGHLDTLLQDFARSAGGHYLKYDFTSPQNLHAANLVSFGQRELPYYDLANSRYVLSFGADFVATWLSPVHHGLAYGELRQGTPGSRGHLVQIEPRMSQTGANADEWIAARPGSEGLLALGIAHLIVQSGAGGRDRSRWTQVLGRYTLDFVAQQTGVSAQIIARLAAAFAGSKAPLAIGGGAMASGSNGVASLLAVNALNMLVGNINRKGGVIFNPEPAIAPSNARSGYAALMQLQQSMEEGKVELLIVAGTNPVFTLPGASGFRDALAKVPDIVSLSSFMDETTAMADIVLPTHTFLEDWGDDVPSPGVGFAVASLSQPVVAPLVDSRSTGDILLELARRLGGTAARAMPWSSTQDYLKACWRDIYAARSGQIDAGSFALFWDAVLEAGVWGEGRPAAGAAHTAPAGGLSQAADWQAPEFDGDRPFHFQPFLTQGFLDGRGANLPWIQELPDPLTSIVYDSWVELNPATAAELGVRDGDVVAIESDHGTLTSPVHISHGIRPDTVAMPIGQGHEHYGRYASGRGANPLSIVANRTDGRSGELAWAATRVSVRPTGERKWVVKTDGTTRELGRQILGPEDGHAAATDAGEHHG